MSDELHADIQKAAANVRRVMEAWAREVEKSMNEFTRVLSEGMKRGE